MADIFRKKALEKLSSPEQLDKMIVINSPMSRLALIGGAFIIIAVLIWGIFGRIPITKEGSGILLQDGELTSVYSKTQGVVVKSYVSSGDEVKKGDVLFEVSSEELAQRVADLEDRINKVDAVTFGSSNDIVTSDNQPLMDIKNQEPNLSLEANAYKAQLDELNKQYKSKKKMVAELEAVMDSTKAAYEADSINQAKASAAQLAYSEYSTANAELNSIAAQVSSAKVQAESGSDASSVQKATLRKQFDSAKAAIMDGLNRELETYYKLEKGQQIKASADGTVFSTMVSNGSEVGVDMEVARINERGGEVGYTAVYYMQLSNGKNIKEGMKVNIYPSTCPKEEYGHMSGTVVKVADFVTSYSDLQSRVGDMMLTETFAGNGPVVEVVCEIEKDETTASGFAWTSEKGETVELKGGTLLGGSVVIEEARPISMLIPKIKEKLNTQIEPEADKENSK